MTAFEFLRVTCWLFFVMEALTALVVAFLPVQPEDLAIADDVVFRCSIAALVSLALLGIIRWLQHRGG